jgi:hypothetical protein
MHPTHSRLALIALLGALLVAPAGAATRPADLRTPDARDAALTAAAGQDLRSPDARDAALTAAAGQDPPPLPGPPTWPLHPQPLTPLTEPAPGAPSGEPSARGFDWSDAAVGAVTAIGLVLFASGAALIVRRRAHREQFTAVS